MVITWFQIVTLFLLLLMTLFRKQVEILIDSIVEEVKKRAVFFVTWIMVIVLLAITLIWPWDMVKTNRGFSLFLLFIGILLLPSLKSLDVLKIFKIELRELNESVQKLRETVLNLSIRNTQNINIFSTQETTRI